MSRRSRIQLLVGLALVLFSLTFSGLAGTTSAHASPLPWCGTGEPSTDLTDAVSAVEWHVIYAIPSGGQDRFGYFASRIAGDVAAVSNWWVGQDPTRRPRFDLVDAPGCATEFQRVDITVAHLPRPNGEPVSQIEDDLRAQGFSSPDKGYLVYYDGSLDTSDEYGVCGQGGVADGPWAYTVIYLQACFQATSDDYRAVTAAHEMIHGMGAVSSRAPHYCDSGHVCDSPSDLMKAIVSDGEMLGGTTLDVGRDDYYAHSGAWYDLQDSGLLYRLDLSLAPAQPVSATATNVGAVVQVSWHTPRLDTRIYYRVYDTGGKVVRTDPSSSLIASGDDGQTLTWTIRTYDSGGFLGPATTLRFKVGYGIVDASGAVTTDTVPPHDMGTLRQSRSGTSVILRWAPVTDSVGLGGYRVTAPGGVNLLVKSPTVRLSLAKLRGKKITVVAVDLAGNAGNSATIVARG